MREQVMETMQQYDMHTRGGVVLAAVSGGRDSMVLLRVLHSLRDIMHFRLCAVHVNHGLRKNAMADQRLVETYASTLNIPLHTFEVCVPQNRKSGESVEMAARRLRYAAFVQALEAYPKGSVLATAHHQRDQAETVLMRLMRGAGTRGLAGIRPVRGVFVRPMLFVPDEDIERYMKDYAVPYHVDQSNMELCYVRNRIRHTLLPELKEQYNPNLERALAATAKAAYEDEMYLQSLAAAQHGALGWRFIPGLAVYMQSEAYLALPIPLQKRVLRMALAQLVIHHMEENTLLSALAAIQKGGAAQLSRDVFVRGGHYVQVYRTIAPSEDTVLLPPNGACRLGLFCMEAKYVVDRAEKPDMWTAYLTEEAANAGLRARTRQTGDQIEYQYGHKKLSDALIDNRVPLCVRDHLPVALCGDEVVWTPGLRVADRFAPTERHRRVLQITVKTEPYDGGIGDV